MTDIPGSESRRARHHGRAYVLFLSASAVLVTVLTLVSSIGVPDRIIGYLLVGATLAGFAAIGTATGTMQIREFFVAGRRIPALYNGMAGASVWLPGVSFMGLAGTIYLLGFDALAFILGWTGGLVLLATLVAPHLRKFGGLTVPDFLAARYGGLPARLAGLLILVTCSFGLLVAQLSAAGLIAVRYLGIDYSVGIYIAFGVLIASTLFGGMRSVTWTQVAQYTVAALAFLVPAVWMAFAKTGNPIPQLAYGAALEAIAGDETAAAFIEPFRNPGFDAWNFSLLILCLAAGTASLPHLLTRYFATSSMRAARTSASWSLLFVAVLLTAAPAYAAFATWTMLDLVNSGLTPANLAEKAGWLSHWGAVDGSLVTVCGAAAGDVAAVASACSAKGVQEALSLQDVVFGPDLIMLATPQMHGMPYIVTAAVAAGGLAAALATASAVLLTMSNALGHDLYFRTIDPSAPPTRRLAAARIALVGIGFFAAYLAAAHPAPFVEAVSWSISVAAAGLFPALVLGIWWKRTTGWGAVTGMLTGSAVALYYIVGTRYGAVHFVDTWQFMSAASAEQLLRFDELKAAFAAAAPEASSTAWAALDTHAQQIASWWGIRNVSAAAFGVPVGLAVTVAVSLLTKPPAPEIEELVEAIRVPRGGVVVDN